MGYDDTIQPEPVSAGMDDKRAMEAGSDVEKLTMTQSPTLKRKLKSRHLQMIAIGMHIPSTALSCCS